MSKAVLVAVLLSIPLCAGAQTWKAPAEGQRCTSKWGPGDERGSMNQVVNGIHLLENLKLDELAA